MYKHCAVAKCQKDAIVKHIYILLLGQYLKLIDVSCITYNIASNNECNNLLVFTFHGVMINCVPYSGFQTWNSGFSKKPSPSP